MIRFKGWDKSPLVKQLTKVKEKAKVNEKELAIGQALHDAGILFETQYRFHPVRKWRFDFLLPEYNIAIEYNGGQWVQGRHTRGAGYAGDLEKINEAQKMGYIVLQYTTNIFSKQGNGTNQIIRDIKEIINGRI
jgi:very-short-patch-repair endonuclease